MRSADVRELARALAALPEGTLVETNAVGNLMMLSEGGVYLGYVEVRHPVEVHWDDGHGYGTAGL